MTESYRRDGDESDELSNTLRNFVLIMNQMFENIKLGKNISPAFLNKVISHTDDIELLIRQEQQLRYDSWYKIPIKKMRFTYDLKHQSLINITTNMLSQIYSFYKDNISMIRVVSTWEYIKYIVNTTIDQERENFLRKSVTNEMFLSEKFNAKGGRKRRQRKRNN